jgi:hypothetical protein
VAEALGLGTDRRSPNKDLSKSKMQLYKNAEGKLIGTPMSVISLTSKWSELTNDGVD